MKRLAYGCARTTFFISIPAGFVITGAVLSFCGMSFDKSAVFKLPADLRKVALIGREVQGSAYALEVLDLGLDLTGKFGQRLLGALELGVAVKVFLGVSGRRESGIQRDRDLLAGIIIIQLTGFCTFRHRIAVGIEKLTIHSVFVTLVCVIDLPALQIVLVNVPLQDGLDDTAQIRGFLPDPGVLVFLRVEGLQQLRHGREADFFKAIGKIGKDPHRDGGITDGSAAA